MEYYGTLGPSCARADVLRDMIRAGMTGLRINLSHGGLQSHSDWIRMAQDAARQEGIRLQILIDLEGPELRIGQLPAPIRLQEGTMVRLQDLGIPAFILEKLDSGDEILLDDGKLLVRTVEGMTGHHQEAEARVLRGGLLESRKSLAVKGKDFSLPTLTDHDLNNLAVAGELGVTGVMLPFARNRRDLVNLREALALAGIPGTRVFAKIENMTGVSNLAELIPDADEIVIARGDLGNSMPLWKLPGVQKKICSVCRNARKPFMVVTQMLDSMRSRAVPTRAEVMDVYQAVLDGAASVMLTGETASGDYPAEAMTYLVNTGREAIEDMKLA